MSDQLASLQASSETNMQTEGMRIKAEPGASEVSMSDYNQTLEQIIREARDLVRPSSSQVANGSRSLTHTAVQPEQPIAVQDTTVPPSAVVPVQSAYAHENTLVDLQRTSPKEPLAQRFPDSRGSLTDNGHETVLGAISDPNVRYGDVEEDRLRPDKTLVDAPKHHRAVREAQEPRKADQDRVRSDSEIRRPMSTEREMEYRNREISQNVMALNNGAMGKHYRVGYDIYGDQKTNEWYGSVHIGRHVYRLPKAAASSREAKGELAKIGLAKLEGLRKASISELNYKPQIPKDPPYGHIKPLGYEFKDPANKPTNPDSKFSETSKTRTAPVIHEPMPRHSLPESYNYVCILNEYIQTLGPHAKRPVIRTAQEESLFKPKAERGFTCFVTLPEHDMRTFGSGRKYFANENAAKNIAARKAVEWLLEKGHLHGIDPDGHVRKRSLPSASEDGPHSKRARASSVGSETRRRPDTYVQPSRLHVVSNSQSVRPSSPRGRDCNCPGSTNDTNNCRLEQQQLCNVDIVRPSSAAAAPPRSPEVPVAAKSIRGLQTSNGSSSPVNKALPEAETSTKSYVDMVAQLAPALGYKQPLYYWMPDDPGMSPDNLFNCSAHVPNHIENGVLNGAIVQLRRVQLPDGASQAQEAIAKETYKWLRKQYDKKMEELAAVSQMMRSMLPE